MTVESLLSLQQKAWLYDDVVAVVLRFFAASADNPRLAFFDSRFFQSLLEIKVVNGETVSEHYAYHKVRKFSMIRLQGKSPYEFQMMFFLINEGGIHWKLIVVNPIARQMVNLCSMHWTSNKYRDLIFRWMYDHVKFYYPSDLDKVFLPNEKDYGWTFVDDFEVPSQSDSHNCGVFALAFVRALMIFRNPRHLNRDHLVEYRKTIFATLAPKNLVKCLVDQNNWAPIIFDPPATDRLGTKVVWSSKAALLPRLSDRDRGTNSVLPSNRQTLTPEQTREYKQQLQAAREAQRAQIKRNREKIAKDLAKKKEREEIRKKAANEKKQQEKIGRDEAIKKANAAVSKLLKTTRS